MEILNRPEVGRTISAWVVFACQPKPKFFPAAGGWLPNPPFKAFETEEMALAFIAAR